MKPELTVVWDGRRNGPGGAMLFADEGERSDHELETTRSGQHNGAWERARFAAVRFGIGWFEPNDLADAANITLVQAHSCLRGWQKTGLVIRRAGVRVLYRMVPR